MSDERIVLCPILVGAASSYAKGYGVSWELYYLKLPSDFTLDNGISRVCRTKIFCWNPSDQTLHLPLENVNRGDKVKWMYSANFPTSTGRDDHIREIRSIVTYINEVELVIESQPTLTEPVCTCESIDLIRFGGQCDYAKWKKNLTKGV